MQRTITPRAEAPRIDLAEGAVRGYTLAELAELLAGVDNSGGVDAYQIAAAREMAHRVLGAPM